MPSQTKVKTENFDATKYHGLDRNALIRIYRTMFLSRQLTTEKSSSNARIKSSSR